MKIIAGGNPRGPVPGIKAKRVAKSGEVGAKVIELGKLARKKYGNKVFEGDCGQFAYAVWMYLKSPKITLAMIYRDTGEFTSLRQLMDEETDIYHVVLNIDGTLYDASGKIDEDYLLNFAQRRYKDDNPGYVNNIEWSEKDDMRLLISSETDWSHQWPDYYKLFDAQVKP